MTGVAGFIGSTLAERLVFDGFDVRGVDCFTPYYAETEKRANLERLLATARFELVSADLRDAAIEPLLDGIDFVFHQAGQPGVRLSWAEGFGDYASHNVLATQRLLEGSVAAKVLRFVYASSSSVYGNAAAYPTTETTLPKPHSPYGVTKLAGEHLCGLYAENYGLRTTSLRYFTVYGPRQRPDMGIRRLIEAALSGVPFPLYGDGSQIRDFTYVDDVVEANLAAARTDLAAGSVVNVAGGGHTTVNDLVSLVGKVTGLAVPLTTLPEQHGDVARTGGSIDAAHQLLGWSPRVGIAEGVERQVTWQTSRPRFAAQVI